MSRLSQDRLKKLLSYNPNTGVFTRRVNVGNQIAGTRAGCLKRDKYRYVDVDGTKYLEGRLAWFYVTGEFPKNHIDHINGCKSDNRIANLRPATHAENCRNQGVRSNNSSGFKGVFFNKDKNKWTATIQKDGVRKHLGHFDKIDQAAEAYKLAALKYHGEFARVE